LRRHARPSAIAPPAKIIPTIKIACKDTSKPFHQDEEGEDKPVEGEEEEPVLEELLEGRTVRPGTGEEVKKKTSPSVAMTRRRKKKRKRKRKKRKKRKKRRKKKKKTKKGWGEAREAPNRSCH
jgi:hypothetical protein